MRRLAVLPTLLPAALLTLVAAATPLAARRPVCPDGRFVQSAPVLPRSSAFGAIVIADGRVSIEGGCEPAKAHRRGLRTGDTKVRARWKRCGSLRNVRLNATIIEDGEPCRRLLGTVRAKREETTPVSAIRSAGDPIVVPANTWEWVPFSDAYCANGVPTGIGVNRGSPGGRLFIYMQGGGACWNELTCFTLRTASYVDSGYTKAQFDGDGFLGISFFDRDDVTNPFRNDSFVYVPYCTGDVHAGSKPDARYGTRTVQHVGFQNMTAYLRRLAPTFPDASRVVLSGSSAGGFGALTNWWQTQQAFGPVRVDLVDDSGPPLPNLGAGLEQDWRNAWNLAAASPPGCTACADDLHAVFAFYNTSFPGHRAALLSYTQDNVIGTFFQLSGPSVEAGLDSLATIMGPLDIWRHFYVTGSAHTMLATLDVSQNGVSVRTFLTQMITDDAAWASVEP